MAYVDSVVSATETEVGFNRTRPEELGAGVGSPRSNSVTEIVQYDGDNVGIQQMLAILTDSDKYQVGLVLPRLEPSTNLGSFNRVITVQIVLLPLTWKEISASMLHGDRGATSVLPIGQGVRFGDIFVDFDCFRVSRHGEEVFMTALEFKVLKFLITNQDRVISRNELLNKVWGYNNYPSTRTVDNQIMKLRQKLEIDPTHPVHFRTVHGVGYRFVG